MRVIIRFSLDGDDGTLTSALASVLKRNGFPKKSRTGSYEGSDRNVGIDSLRTGLDEFWERIQGQKRAKLDHFWMYVDKRTTARPRKKSSKQKTA